MTRFPLVLYYSCLSFFSFLSSRKYRRTKVSIVLEIIYQVPERERLFSKVFWRIRGSFYSYHTWASRWIYLCNYFNIILKLLILINKKRFRWFRIFVPIVIKIFIVVNEIWRVKIKKDFIDFEFIKIAIVFVFFLDLFIVVNEIWVKIKKDFVDLESSLSKLLSKLQLFSSSSLIFLSSWMKFDDWAKIKKRISLI